MDQKFLLTYQTLKGSGFAWFESEEELFDFVDANDEINIIEALYIKEAESLIE